MVRDDGASGKDLSRPGIQSALQRLADGEAETLVASRLDRISRSALDFLTLVEWAKRHRLALVVLDLNLDTGTPSGEFFAGMMAQVAQLERGLIAERTRAALGVRRDRGQAVGRPGVRDSAPEVAERIQQERSEGRTWSAIAAGLNLDAVPTVRGGAMWRVSSVQSAGGYRRPPASRRTVALPESTPRRRSARLTQISLNGGPRSDRSAVRGVAGAPRSSG